LSICGGGLVLAAGAFFIQKASGKDSGDHSLCVVWVSFCHRQSSKAPNGVFAGTGSHARGRGGRSEKLQRTKVSDQHF